MFVCLSHFQRLLCVVYQINVAGQSCKKSESVSVAKTHSPGFLKLVEAAKNFVRECTVDDMLQYRARGTTSVLIDVREDHEWDAGRIPGSIHLGKGIIERDIETAVGEKSTKIILYCGGGFRSVLAAKSLSEMGYSNVFSMVGGYRAWVESQQPIERDAK